MTTGKALLGVLAGFTAGAVLGILFAPEKGSVIRKTIARKGEDVLDNLNGKIEGKIADVVTAVKGSVLKSKHADIARTPESVSA